MEEVGPRRRDRGPVVHHYDLHGLVMLRSDVPFKELAPFRTEATPRPADIVVEIGPVGGAPRRRVSVARSAGRVVYEEHMGRLGASVGVDMGEPVRVTATWLFARSAHVLYTNVVEAVIRYVLVSKGHLLVHCATVVLNGRGVMLTARTDTGKTGAVLRLARDFGASFLSDDMTILDPSGTALSFPKPLTISAHTLHAIRRSPLRSRQRGVLAVQSRIHSKSGRSFGQRLAEGNVPIVTINALTQMVVPPPKYTIDSLVTCPAESSTPVQDLFILERGPRSDEDITHDQAVAILLENTEDAYQFPPSRELMESFVIGGDDYANLQRKERSLLSGALDGIRVRRLSRDDFSWADDVAALVPGAEADQ